MSDFDSPLFLPEDPQGDSPKGRSSRTVLIAALLGAGGLFGLLVCGGVILAILAATGDFDPDAWLPSIEMPAADVESPEEERAAVTAAFASREVGVGEKELARIRKLFDAIVAAASAEDEAAFARLIDYDRLGLQIKKSGVIRRMSTFEDDSLGDWVREMVWMPGYWDRYKLVRIELAPAGGEAVVYGYFWQAEEAVEVRWWLVADGLGWKVYDWDVLAFGTRNSYEMAVFWRHTDNPHYDDHMRVYWDVSGADEAMNEGDYEKAAEKIGRAERRRLLPELADERRLAIAYAWSRCGKTRECLAACRRIAKPEQTPGVFHAEALCYRQIGRNRKLVEILDRFVHQLGRGPEACSLRGDALMNLGRFDEAAQEWRDVLRNDPENVAALQSFGRSLPADGKGELADAVRRHSDPAATAETVGSHLAGYADAAGVTAMLGLLGSGSPRSLAIEATALEAADDYAGAADLLKRAWTAEADEELKSNYRNRYYNALLGAEQPLEAYESADDRRQAFSYLTGWYDESEMEVSDDALRKLVDAHRVHHPDDPALFLQSGMLLLRERRFDEAAQEFVRGIEQVGDELAESIDAGDDEGSEDDYVLSSLQYQRLLALTEAGRPIEAYEAAADPSAAFTQIAAILRLRERTAPLRQLIERHRADHPDEPWLDFYEAAAELADDRFAEADHLLARAQEQAGDNEYLRNSSRSLRLESRAERGDALSAYEEVPSPAEVFPWLAAQLQSQEDWTSLRILVDRHRRGDDARTAPNRTISSEAATAAAWDVELAWSTRDWDSVVGQLVPWPRHFTLHADVAERFGLHQKLVRSLLRLGRAREALTVAEQVYKESVDPLPLILVYAHERNLDRVEHYLADYDPHSYHLRSLYSDEDAGPVLCGDEFRPLRRRHPPGLRGGSAEEVGLLLLKSPASLDTAAIRQRAVDVFEQPVTVEELGAATGDDAMTSWLLSAEGCRLALTLGSDRYVREAALKEISLAQEPLQSAVQNHAGWIAITRLPGTTTDGQELSATVRGLIAAFADENCLAFEVPLSPQQHPLVANTAETRRLLAQPRPGAQLARLGETVWLFRAPQGPDGEDEFEASERHRRELQRLGAGIWERPQQGLQVDVSFRVGTLGERLRLDVEQVDHRIYGHPVFVGTLRDSSQLHPLLQAGEPVAAELFEVHGWRLGDESAAEAERE